MATRFVELDEVCSLFPPVSAKVIAALIARAAEREIREQRRHIRAAVLGSYPGVSFADAVARHLAAHLGKSLRQRGASSHEMPSIRHKSPTSGGRPFHFAHSVVGRSTGSPKPGAKTAQPSKAAAHMTYVERAAAVEKGITRAEGRSAAAIDPGWEREVGGTGAESSASASQSYVENPQKVTSDGNEVVFSFGNIGDTFAERSDFWLKLEAAETRSNARIQNRLILELPHEATPAARYEMVQAFCVRFERDGVPYWAALHAPGKKNDSRNFHAHVVFSERPAKRIVDPDDGQTKWDFEITTVRVYSNRTKHVSRPHRQDKSRFYSSRAFIPTLRKEFATIVNKITTRDGVRDKDGDPVRYDPRSYQDMGVDVVPMRSIDRIVSDKLRRGKLTILDNDYTKKMITRALQEAAAQRDAVLVDLHRLEQHLKALAAKPGHAGTIAPMLEPSLRPAPDAILTNTALKQAAGPLLAARREACVHEVITKTARATLDRIIEASNPRLIEQSQTNTRDPIRRGHLPDPETMEHVHREACAMRKELEQDTKVERLQVTRRMNIALGQWQALVQPKAHSSKTRRPPPQPGATGPIREEVQKAATPEAETPHRQQAAAGPELTRLRRAPITREIIEEASKQVSAMIASFKKIPDVQQRVDAMRQYPAQRAREMAEARSRSEPSQAQPPQSVSEPPREEASRGEATTLGPSANTNSGKCEGVEAGATKQPALQPEKPETVVTEMDVTDHLARKPSQPEDPPVADHQVASTSTAGGPPSAETHVFDEDEEELDENVAKSRGRVKQEGTPPELDGSLPNQTRATVEQGRAGRVGKPRRVDGQRAESSGNPGRKPRDVRRIVLDAPLVVDEISVEVAGGIAPMHHGTAPGRLVTTRPGHPIAGADQPVHTAPDQPPREPDVQHGEARNGPDRQGVVGETGQSPSREGHPSDTPASEPAVDVRGRSRRRPGSTRRRDGGHGLAD